MKKPLIIIGESIHASIPKTGKIMTRLKQLGSDAYTKPSEPLDYIRNLIESQAVDGADYIAVNLDAFGEERPQVAVDMMCEYVKMVRKWGNGVPVCIDSSDDNVLKAGLEEWYDSEQDVAQPLVNSVKVYTMNGMFGLKKDYDYAFVALLMDDSGKSHSIDNLYSIARRLFDEAVGKCDFRPEEIFFDSTIFPLAIDMPMQPGEPGYTYKTFETIRKIKSDPAMCGVHFTGGMTNCARDLPARKVGIIRAFVHKAMEYGLDSAIANPTHHLGEAEPDPQLLELVDAYAKMDGSMENMSRAMMLMGKFCQESRKPTN